MSINKSTKNGPAIAVVLNYDGKVMQAPEISMLGRGEHAKEILKISRKYGIPTKKNVELAQKLEKVPATTQIPEELYQEVAQVFISLNCKKVG